MSDEPICLFDHYLKDDGPAALVIREYLMPVEGPDGVLFPATFAAGDGFPGGYNIDSGPNGTNVCLIDSVGSQANRIEPIFMQEKYKSLVPQIIVRAGEKNVNLLEAGHRAGDAIIRCSGLQAKIHEAFKESLKGNAEPLAKIAPTSMVFGVWDSRNTQEKRPRLIASTIRAFNVRKLTRGAVYLPPVNYVEDGLIDAELDKGSGKDNPLSVKGFKHNPASATHGGVIADGGIRRDATLSLAALRLLHAGQDKDKTYKLQCYILGLSLVAFTANTVNYLRQGCILVRNPDKASENVFVEVYPNGERKPCDVKHELALQYARIAAEAFGVGADEEVDFDKKLAQQDIQGEGEGKAKDKKRKKSE
jgi:CRISPR-associated protein Csb1